MATSTMKRVLVSLLLVAVLCMIVETFVFGRTWRFLFADMTPAQPGEREEQYPGFLQRAHLPAHDKWIVVDTSPAGCRPSLQVPRGWKLLVPGDSARTAGCSQATCVLPPPDGERSERRWVWRNAAYLAAIASGARLVLDAECWVSLGDAVQTVQLASGGPEHGLMYNATALFNPYSHFGARGWVPRAVSRGGLAPNSRLLYVRDFQRVHVKQAFSPDSPDAVPGPGSSDGLGARFEPSTPPVFLGQASFCPALPECGLYRPESLWALLLPCYSPLPRCRVVRQYVTQRLLRELDAFSGLYQLPAASARRQNSDTNPQSAEPADVAHLHSVLGAWECRTNLSFFQCFAHLADHLMKHGVVTVEESSLVKLWLAVLQKMEIVEPVRVARPWRGVRKTSEVRVVLADSPYTLESDPAAGNVSNMRTFTDELGSVCNVSRDILLGIQQHWTKPLINDIVLIVIFNSDKFVLKNVPLVESVHRPYFKHIIYCVSNVEKLLKEDTNSYLRHVSLVEGMSDGWFLFYECITTVAHMNIKGIKGYLHIGDDTLLNTWALLNANRDMMLMPSGGRIISAQMDRYQHWIWYNSPRGRSVLLKTLAGLEKISGLSNDQILALHSSSLNNRHVSNMTFASFTSALTASNNVSLEPFLAKYSGFQQMRSLSENQIKALDGSTMKVFGASQPVPTFSMLYEKTNTVNTLLHLALIGSEDWPRPTRDQALRFVRNYYGANSMGGLVHFNAIDFLYLPQVLAADFVNFSRWFMRHGVMDEMAFPALHYGLTAVARGVRYVPGTSLWGADRVRPAAVFNQMHFYMHPFKLNASMKDKGLQSFFCRVYLGHLTSNLRKHGR